MNMDLSLPLNDKTVVLTRSQDQNSEARFLFESKGAKVLELPALVIAPPDNWSPLDASLLELKKYDWMIFSSSNGINSVEKRLKLIGSSLSDKPKHLKVAVVGKKTAKALQKLHLKPNFVPPEFVADSLIEHFPCSPKGLRILIPRVQTGGRTILEKAFTKRGSIVTEVAAYESKCPKDIPDETIKAFRNLEVDILVFTSYKTTAHSIQLMNKFFGDQTNRILSDVKIISIGPQTSIGCKKYFNKLDNQAKKYDLDGLVNACIESIENENK